MLTFLAAAALAIPQPSRLRTFGDWIVGCDNGRACQAVSLFPEGGSQRGSIVIKRGAEADATPEIRITARNNDFDEITPAVLLIDAQSFPLSADADRGSAPRGPAAVAARLGQATRISLLAASGGVMGQVSTKGSAAALLYMDEQQRRVGTTGALVRRGLRAIVPPPPALPVVVVPPATSHSPRALSVARVRKLLGTEATVCEEANALVIEAARLDARSSLVLANQPCNYGAYNFMWSAYIVDERGEVRAPTFDDGAHKVDSEDYLVNLGWVPGTRRLTSYEKARGLGDCGVRQEYAWDGARFRLVSETVMDECRGSMDYISTWRARVVEGR